MRAIWTSGTVLSSLRGRSLPYSSHDIKALADGQVAQASVLIASSAAGELGSSIYVQEADRTSGVQLNFTGTVPSVSRRHGARYPGHNRYNKRGTGAE